VQHSLQRYQRDSGRASHIAQPCPLSGKPDIELTSPVPAERISGHANGSAGHCALRPPRIVTAYVA